MTAWKVINNLTKEFSTDNIQETIRDFGEGVTFFTAVRVGDGKERQCCDNCEMYSGISCIETGDKMNKLDHCQCWEARK